MANETSEYQPRTATEIPVYGLDLEKVSWHAAYNHEIGKATAEIVRRIEEDIFARMNDPGV